MHQPRYGDHVGLEASRRLADGDENVLVDPLVASRYGLYTLSSCTHAGHCVSSVPARCVRYLIRPYPPLFQGFAVAQPIIGEAGKWRAIVQPRGVGSGVQTHAYGNLLQ